jgi:hypothetical protein
MGKIMKSNHVLQEETGFLCKYTNKFKVTVEKYISFQYNQKDTMVSILTSDKTEFK